MKFQPATSTRPATLWVASAAVVLLAGEVARGAAWPALAALALAALALAVLAWLQQRPGERGLAVGLVLLAATCSVAAGMIGHTKLHANALQGEATRTASANQDRILRSAVAAASRTATLALERTGLRPDVKPHDLDDLVGNGDVETSLAVVAGDTVIAVAGPQRMQPIRGSAPAAVISTPFARMLVIRERRAQREAQVVLLLDSLPGLLVAGPSLAAASGPDVSWAWPAAFDHPVEFNSVPAAIAGVKSAMRPVASPVSAFLVREAFTARLLVGAGLLFIALVLLLTTTQPAVRAGAILVPLWALSRSGVGATVVEIGAARPILAALGLLLLAIVLWQRPARRTAVGLAASVLLLGSAPPLVLLLARSLLPHSQQLSLLGAFGWQLVIALATAGFLAVAMAPLRAPGDQDASATWGIVATTLLLMVGLVGIEAWSPGTLVQPDRWASWYAPLWLVPIAMLLPVMNPRIRLIAVATMAGACAALATQVTSLDRRIDLAAADLARLNAPADTATLAALDSFAIAARQNHATRLDRLYATWQASSLARADVPAYLALWSASGNQREAVALDSLIVSWFELDSLVRSAGAEPRHFPLSRRVGHHEVLILPLAPDTIATLTVGPRSRLLVPTTFGLLVGSRGSTGDPPYRVYVPGEGDTPHDGQFHRDHRWIRADTTAGDPPRVVRAEVAILPWAPFVVRAALGVLLDVGLIVGVWFLLQRLLGQVHATALPLFRQSYRRLVATALMAFFIVPAIAFTLAAIMRLQREAKRQLDAEVSATMRVVRDANGLALAESAHPTSQPLAFVADTANAEVGIYRQGRLIAASDSMLAELGLMPPIIDRAASAGGVGVITSLANPLPTADLRLGVMSTATPGTALLVALPGGDTGLAAEQVDQALVLLLATLTGIAASMVVAGVMARSLGGPIETLRRTAVAIGRHEAPPTATDVPAEFVPVFGAIAQMERDLRATEAELQAGRTRTAAILSTVATGVIGADATGTVIHVNPRATELLGREIGLGGNLASQLPNGWQRVVEGIERLLGDATRTSESRELQNGEQRFAVTLAPLGDGGLVLAITDITEASRAARVLAWGEMARQVAHEIKNPLTPMRLGLQHLRRVRKDNPPEFAQLVDDTAERLLAEIERLDRIARSFARYGAPPERAAPLEAINLQAITEEISSLFALGAERLQVTVTGVAAAPVAARREELVQVLLNLLDNSRQAGASSVHLQLGAEMLRVEDDGKGIPADQLGRIFEPSFSTNTSGTGLGLAIVRRLVEGWGATIAVESGAGAGAVFTIRFNPPGPAHVPVPSP